MRGILTLKKKLFAGMLIGVFSLGMAACGGGDEKSSSGDANEDAVELEMYSWRTEDRAAYSTPFSVPSLPLGE